MHVERIAYADTGRFSAAVIDHLASEPFIREFLQLSPDREGLRSAARERAFEPAHRAVLCEALERQHARLVLDPAVRRNLDRLRDERSLTVTTGHQLCLFTGPLYLPYKILNVIRLARTMEQDLGRPVIPVFWMASEDHDLAEVDHAVINGQAVRWTSGGAGAVGRLALTGISAQVEEVVTALGGGAEAAQIASMLREAYREDRTLAEATRHFVHALFGRFGLVIIDGDDPALKRLFAPVIQEEVVNRITERTVRYANDRIGERYKVQAHAREINLFHLREGHRSRIVPDGDHYQVLDGGARWTLDQLMVEVHLRPQDFSPNVLLRPVYQEMVLPNIAYVGGGGELAYWVQLRWLFQALRVPMPVVMLRTSAATISAKQMRQWTDAGLSTSDLFAPLDPMKAAVAKRGAGFATDLLAERTELDRLYAVILAKAAQGDASLRGAADARRTQALRGVDRLEKAMVRAAKRDQEVIMRRMDAIHNAVVPGGGLQERRDNILPLLAAHGTGELDRWLDLLDPLDPTFAVVVVD